MNSSVTSPLRRPAQSVALACLVLLPGFLMAGEKIIFSSRASTQAVSTPPARSGPIFEPDFNTSPRIRTAEPEMAVAPKTAAARPALTKKQLEMLDRRKNWIFEKPEDIGKNETADTSSLEPKDMLEDKNGKPVTAVERFLEGEHRKGDGKSISHTSGGSGEREKERVPRNDNLLEAGSRGGMDSFSRNGEGRFPSNPFGSDRRSVDPLFGNAPSQGALSGQSGSVGFDAASQRARQSESRTRSEELGRLLNPGLNAPSASSGERMLNSGGSQNSPFAGGGLGDLTRGNERFGSPNSQGGFRGLELNRSAFGDAPAAPSWTAPERANPVLQPATAQPTFQKPAILEIPKRKF